MRDSVHGYANGRHNTPPLKPFDVIERVRAEDGSWAGRRTDTVTSSVRYAIERRDDLRRQGRPAYVIDKDGVRVEVARWR